MIVIRWVGAWWLGYVIIGSLNFNEMIVIRWVGAWWLGYVIIGSLIFLFAIPLLFFPKNLPEEVGHNPPETVQGKGDEEEVEEEGKK